MFEMSAGVIALFYLSMMVTGHGPEFWQAVKWMKKHVISESKKDWGCPSIFNKGACNSYDPSRYK